MVNIAVKFRIINYLFLVIFLFSLSLTINTYAGCVCKCVNRQVRAICSSSIDFKPICSPQICPIDTPSIKPVDSIIVPPIGTKNCTNKRVLNNYTGQYEWKVLCE